MDVTSNKSVDPKTGIVLRDKNGPSGIVEKPHDYTYVNNVELYRRQLWRGALRQNDAYPVRQKLTKALFNEKLMKYANRAGFNYHDIFDINELQEKDLLIGWAGKKLKDKMREKGQVHFGRRRKPVKRVVLRSVIHHMSLGHNLSIFQMVPASPLEPVTLHDLDRIIDCRNGNKGQLQFVDGKQNTILTIPYIRDKSFPEGQVIAQWANLTIPRSRPTTEGEVRPLFREPIMRPRRRSALKDFGPVISESTIESSPSQFSPTYLTPPVEKKDVE